RRRRRLVRIGLETDTEFEQQFLGIGQDIHQRADRRALVAADIADAVLQHPLGKGQETFAGKALSLAEAQMPDLGLERSLRHLPSPSATHERAGPAVTRDQISCLRMFFRTFCKVPTKARLSSSGTPRNISAS